MALAPVAFFFLAAIVLSSATMVLATSVFALGHLVNSRREYRRCAQAMSEN